MNPKRAAEILSLDLEDATVESVGTAAAQAIRAAHPDAGGDPETAPDQIKLAKQCRDVLIAHLNKGFTPGKRECPACKGRGELVVKRLVPRP